MSKADSPYAVGRRWAVATPDREVAPFDFVIVEPSRPGHKVCRVEVAPLWYRERGYSRDVMRAVARAGHGIQQEYPHTHLKKHAVLVPVGVDSDVQRQWAAERSGDYRDVLLALPEMQALEPRVRDELYAAALQQAQAQPRLEGYSLYPDLRVGLARLLSARAVDNR